MSAARVRKFTDIADAEFFLRGGYKTSRQIPTFAGETNRSFGGGLQGLVGLTLTFVLPTPAAWVFVPATPPMGSDRDPNVLLYGDIKAQLETNITGLFVASVGGFLGFIEAIPSGGIELAALDEPARVLLGMGSTSTAIKTAVYNAPGGGAPSFEYAYNANSAGQHVIYTWE